MAELNEKDAHGENIEDFKIVFELNSVEIEYHNSRGVACNENFKNKVAINYLIASFEINPYYSIARLINRNTKRIHKVHSAIGFSYALQSLAIRMTLKPLCALSSIMIRQISYCRNRIKKVAMNHGNRQENRICDTYLVYS